MKSVVAAFLLGVLLGFGLASWWRRPVSDQDSSDPRDAVSHEPTPPVTLPQPPRPSDPVIDAAGADSDPISDPEPSRLPRVDWDRTCTLVVTVANEWGEPEGNQSFRVSVHFGEHEWGDYRTTDPSGNLTFTVRGAVPTDSGRLCVRPGTASYGFTLYVPPSRFGSLELPPDLPTGTLDLGVLRLVEPPVVVRGRVTDLNGAPLSASIKVSTRAEGEELPVFYGAIESDSDGSFSFHSPTSPTTPEVAFDRLRQAWLSVKCPGFASIPELEVEPGSEVTVRLLPGRELHGTIVGPRSDPITIEVVGPDQISRSPNSWSPREDAYRWWIRSVPLGPCSVFIQDAAGRTYRGRCRIDADTTTPDLDGVRLR